MNDAGRLYRPVGMLCATGLDLAREVRRLACVAPIHRSNPSPQPRMGDQVIQPIERTREEEVRRPIVVQHAPPRRSRHQQRRAGPIAAKLLGVSRSGIQETSLGVWQPQGAGSSESRSSQI